MEAEAVGEFEPAGDAAFAFLGAVVIDQAAAPFAPPRSARSGSLP
jgi:hypothetical protein